MSLEIKLEPVSEEERAWINSMPRSPFGSMHVTTDKKDVLMMEQHYFHDKFNPFGCLKFYFAAVFHNSEKTYYDVVSIPTGLLYLDQGMQIVVCENGYLHDASGRPAMVSALFGDAYYLHGVNFEPIEYFRFLEKEKGLYPEYQPQRYIDYMANVLGGKS